MQLRHVFIVNTFIALILGVTFTIFPDFIYRLYGVIPDAAAIWIARCLGGAMLGLSTLMWYGARSMSAETRRAIAFALLVQYVISGIASILFQLTGRLNTFGWATIGVYIALALFYTWFLYFRPMAA
jgi:hypothetical protein